MATYIRDVWHWTLGYICWVDEALESVPNRASCLKLTGSQAVGLIISATHDTVAAVEPLLLSEALGTICTHQGTAVQDHCRGLTLITTVVPHLRLQGLKL